MYTKYRITFRTAGAHTTDRVALVHELRLVMGLSLKEAVTHADNLILSGESVIEVMGLKAELAQYTRYEDLTPKRVDHAALERAARDAHRSNMIQLATDILANPRESASAKRLADAVLSGLFNVAPYAGA